MPVNKIITKVDGVINKTIDFNDLKAGLAVGSHTITVEAFNGATLISTQTRNITIASSDTTAPTITTATVEDANPDKLVVVFSEVVTITNTTGLTITGAATPTLSAPTGSGSNTITFTLSTALTNGQSVTLNVSSSNTIKDAANNALAATTKAITNNVAAILGYDVDFQGVLDLATANSIPHPDEPTKTTLNQKVIDLKSNNVWSELEVLTLQNSSASPAFRRICYIRKIVMTEYGSSNWTADGSKGNNSNYYIDTLFNPNTDATKITNADMSIGFKLSEALTSGAITGARVSNDTSQVYIYTSGTSYNPRLLDENATIPLGNINNAIGYHHAQAINTNRSFFFDNVKILEKSTTNIGLPNAKIFIHALNLGGAIQYGNTRLNWYYIGTNLESKKSIINTILG